MEQLKLRPVLNAFDFGKEVESCVRFGEGHINDTFAVTVCGKNGRRRFIVQRINHNVFKDPAGVMENILNVTEFLRKKIAEAGGDPDRETLTVLCTKEGKPYFLDEEGFWRCYLFVEDTICLQAVRGPEDFYNAAYTFGIFQRQLGEYPAENLQETICDFHNTPDRLKKFKQALAADFCGRAATCRPEIDFILARAADCSYMTDLQAAGKLPLRVTHNDTKLNNILIDKSTGKGLCVIDLDTVMPGLAANDFGDSIRFGASTAKEDETDLSKVHFSLELFDIYAKGFLAAAGSALTEAEKETLHWGAKLMTLECAVRFLTDYLEGDTYFKTTHTTHNLERCRTQLRLVEEMEQVFDKMQAILKKYSEV